MKHLHEAQAGLTAVGNRGPLEQTGSQAWMSSYLWNPQGTADMSPFSPGPGSFHGPTSLWTQQTLRMNAQDTGTTQPAAFWDLEDAVAGLEARGGEGRGESG